ncbi:MAG: DUF885 family protein [Gemmatimonadetes bacterium]|nr:DUF885 family protein [Gemmatimonadota bacterium]
MFGPFVRSIPLLAFAAFPLSGPAAAQTSRYDDLVALFKDWRAFQKPKVVNGIPDYSAAAMNAQYQALAGYQRRLKAIDTTGWTVPQQVDYHIVRAEMNGLDFDHRVLRPWEKNPSFYVMVFPSQSDQPAREGPHVEGSIELWTYKFPLDLTSATTIASGLRTIPAVLEQAKKNLTGNNKDLWTAGLRDLAGQSRNLEALATREPRPGRGTALDSAIQQARAATDAFATWVQQQAVSKTEPSGIGVENYDWYLANVKLLPYTWRDQVTMMRRELERSTAALAVEEAKNRKLPPQEPIANAEEWSRRFNAAVTEYLAFLRERAIVTVKDYYEPALRAREGRFSPGPREFFTEVNHRDPIVMLTHNYHWIELAQAEKEPHPDPIRRGPLLYNIFDSRTEGWATGMEEMMANAGFIDSHPRSRELIYILIAQRAARALGDLMMHANRFTYEQAVKFAVANTPRGWLRENGTTVWGEQHLYLQQPAYGTSYLVGKAHLEKIMGELARQEGDRFTIRSFMDKMNAIGMIPTSLVRWEMTGLGDDIPR